MDCDGRCGSIVTERNRYFTGKLLVARDLVQEQSYFLGRHRLHNRLLHGWGVVCGLEVEWHPDRENCADVVIVRPGIAIDCEGRELVLCEPTTARVPKREPDDRAKQAKQSGPEEPGGDDEPAERMFVFLGYAERKTEELPYLYDDCDGCSRGPEANRIRESARADARLARLDAECWPGSGTPAARATRARLEPDASAPNARATRCRSRCSGPTPIRGPTPTSKDAGGSRRPG
jgi:hypothetical protein